MSPLYWLALVPSALGFRPSGRALRRAGRRKQWGNGWVTNIPALLEGLECRQLLSTITVTTTSDAAVHTGISLRDAIATANNDGSGDTITFASSLTGSTITLTQGELPVTSSVTISGTLGGASQITIDGNNSSRILFIYNSGVNSNVVTISNLTLQHGNGVASGANGSGGAIYNSETLNLFGDTIVNNSAAGDEGNGFPGLGGGISNHATLTVTDCTIAGNTVASIPGAGSFGAGIANRNGTVILVNDTITGNSATGTDSTGGGISNGPGQTCVAINTLIVGNTAASSSEVIGTLAAGSQSSLTAIPSGMTLSNILQTDSNGNPLLANNGGPTATVALIGNSTNPALGTGTRPVANLNGAISASATSARVVSAAHLAAGDLLTIDSETVLVKSISGTTLTIARGQSGTTAAAHSNGAGLMVLDQRGVVRNSSPDIGAFETQTATISNVTIAGGTYTGSSFAVTNATVTDANNNTIASFGSLYLSYAYYAGTLDSGQIAGATPLPGAPSNVGSYTVVADYNNAPGYRPATSSPPTSFTITPATLTINASGDTNVYDGTTASSATPTVLGLVGSDTVTGLTEAFESKDVLGTNKSTLDVTGYTVNDGNSGNDYTVSTATAAGTITPAALVITGATDTKVYDGTTASSATPTVLGLVGSDTVTDLTEAFESKDVLGTNKSTLDVTGYTVNDGNSGNDYTVTTVTAAGTITPAVLTIIGATDTKVYDGTTASSATPTVLGLVGSDTVTDLTEAFESKDVLGTNKSTLDVTGYTVNDGNSGNDYTVSTATAAGTITRAALTITATTNTKVYDGRTSASATPTVSGLLGTDTVTNLREAYSSKNVKGTNQSTLFVAGYTLNDGNSGNDYAVTSATGVGAITPAALTITATTNTKVYDGTTAASATPSVSGLVGGDTVTGLREAYISKDVLGLNGSTLNVTGYTINDYNSGNNYTVTTATTAGTITPAPLTVTADSKSKVYGGPDPTLTYTVTGTTYGGDVARNVVTGVTLSTATGTAATVGTHPITATGGVAGNYSITYVNGTLTVTQVATYFALSIPASAVAGSAFSIRVTAKDLYNNTVPGYTGTIHFTSSDTAAVLPADATLVNGTGTFLITLKTAGRQTLTATDTPNSAIVGTSGAITVVLGAATHFVVTAPAGATAGSAFNFTVTAMDAFNNKATGYAGTIRFTSTDPAAHLPANATLTNGTGTFSATFTTAGSRTLRVADAVSTALVGVSSAVNVLAAAATHFVFTLRASTTAGSTNSFAVTAQDPYNNTATGYAGTIHFTSSDPNAVLPADATLVNGTRTFTTLLKTAGNQTLGVADVLDGTVVGTSSPVNVAPGAATHFVLTVPANATAGSAFNFTLTALDRYNNTATGYTGTIHFTSSATGATLPANATLTNGVGTFSATFNTLGQWTLTAKDLLSSALAGTSAAVSVTAR